MKRKIELLMGLCVILCAFVLARKGAVFVQSEQAKSAPVCIVVDAGHGVVDNASDENNENTRRKATVVPIKIEYV